MAILNNLIVNGSSKFLNDAYFNILAADTGKFNKLATKVLGNDGETITVHGLMDVQGELHTKSWSNSNIATIDGSFFICPTLKVTETGSTNNGLTITQSGNTWSIQITSSSAVVTNSVYTVDSSGTVTTTGTWTLGSKVAITGEILVNNEWLPLGTLRGIITNRSNDLKSVTVSNITDGYSSSNNILNTIGAQSNVKHRNVKISLYEWTLSDSGTPLSAVTNPIGIYMTALGDGTGQTMIDIYGGQEPSGNTNTYKGLAKPYVRIGNLSGLSSLSVGGQNPKGWGIYTSNGYFEGTIAARRGYIGNNTKYWTIGTSGTNSTIFSGPTTVSATGTAGTYLGTDGFLNTASNTVYAQITNGILTAKGANITGTIDATSFTAKSYSGNTLNRQMSLGADGLKLMDGSGTILSQIDGSASTIGKTSGNNYNINITGTAIDLRYNANVLNRINSDGMILYDGDGLLDNNIIARLGSTIQIGQNSAAHLALENNELILYDNAATPTAFFKVRDLVNESGQAQETFTGNGTNRFFNLSYTATNTNYTVQVNDNNAATESKSTTSFTLSAAPLIGDIITVTYNVVGNSAKTYELGTRRDGSISGDYSFIAGRYLTASGEASHAEGHSSYALGNISHAEGYFTLATGKGAHSEGYSSSGSQLEAMGTGSHAGGCIGSNIRSIKAYGNGSFAHGYISSGANYNGSIDAIGDGSVAFGFAKNGEIVSSGNGSFTLGVAKGFYWTELAGTPPRTITVHSDGSLRALGEGSGALGIGTQALYNGQLAIGTFNQDDTEPSTAIHPNGTSYGNYAFIIGNGYTHTVNSHTAIQRSNAFTVGWNGNVWASGSLRASTETPTGVTISATSGTLVGYDIRRFGNVIQLRLGVKNTSATASGGNIFEGTISPASLRPLMVTTGATYYASYAVTGTISTAGSIVIRNSDSRSFSALTTNNINISFTYIVA